MNKARRRRKQLKILLIVLLVVCILAICAVVAVIILNSKGKSKQYSSDEVALFASDEDGAAETISYDGKEYRLNENLETVLIMGIDDREGQRFSDGVYYSCADFEFLIILDHENNTYTSIQFDRDSMLRMSALDEKGNETGKVFQQLCLAHAYGTGGDDSCLNVANTISDMLGGIEIDHYLSIDYQSLPTLNDSVGGVTVDIEDDMTSVNERFVQGTTITLQGEEAEQFVRSRMTIGDGTNVARMRRHRQFISGWVTAAKECISQESGFALKLFTALNGHMVSDMTASQLNDFTDYFMDYSDEGIVTFEGEHLETLEEDGIEHTEFYPDESDIQKKVVTLFYVPVSES